MTAKVFFVVSILAILSAFTVFPLMTGAVNYVPGVKAGDWIKYGQYKVTWSGNGTPPSYISDEQKVEWYRIDVENVSGTTVSMNVTVELNNGTQRSAQDDVDVLGNASMGGIPLLIASGLKNGDPVNNLTSSPTINQTTTGTYAGATRNVNLAESTSVSGNQTYTSRIYWDQSTGIMLEIYSKSPVYGGQGYSELSIKATETNMWSPDLLGLLTNNLIFIIIGIIVIILVIAAVLALRRRKPSVGKD